MYNYYFNGEHTLYTNIIYKCNYPAALLVKAIVSVSPFGCNSICKQSLFECKFPGKTF